MKNLKINHISTHELGENAADFAVNTVSGEIVIATSNQFQFLDTGKIVNFENPENVAIISFSIRNGQCLAVLADGRGLVYEEIEGSETNVEEITICDIFDTQKSSAEWSCDEQTLAVSDGTCLSLIDSSLIPFFERPLDFDENERQLVPVSVGWGSEETQFRGSGAKLKPAEKLEGKRENLEGHLSRSIVHWRFDGEFVGVSYFSENVGTRLLTVFNKSGEIISAMNLRNIYLSDCFAMRPNANIICSTVLKKDASDDLVFFEKNGETRNGYTMKWAKNGDLAKKRIKEISWNSTGTILAIHSIVGNEQFLGFWRLSNYEYTQKYVWKISQNVMCWKWSPIDETIIHVLLESGQFFTISIGECASFSPQLEMNFVVATDELRVSALCKRAIPPPMCETTLNFENELMLWTTSANGVLHVLTLDNTIHQFARKSTTTTTQFEKIKSVQIDNEIGPIGAISYDVQGEKYSIWTQNQIDGRNFGPEKIGWFESGQIATLDGQFWSLSGEKLAGRIEEFQAIQVCWVKNHRISLTSDACLFVDSTKIANTIVSMLPKNDDLMVIDFDNKLRFVDFDNLKLFEDSRDVEGGCELVASDSTSANIVLQATRGNLETIQPRRFVIRETRRLFDEKLYIQAFRWMKKHRIDMSFAMEYKYEELSSDAQIWLHNTSDSPLLEQLLVSCTEKDQQKGNELCQTVYDEISKITEISRKTQLFPLLLTSLLRTNPARINDSLKEIQEFSKIVEDRKDVFIRSSLHHVSFFVPAKELFNCALSTYDLKLAQQVAEASNYDPKEYLPVLNRLNKYECELERQYRINVVRENWPDCLRSLFTLDSDEKRGGESEWWTDICEIVKREGLFKEALKIVRKNEKRYRDCCELYANQLETKAMWKEAALFYELAGNVEKTLKSLEMSRDVDGLIAAARRAKIENSKLKIHAIKMSSALREGRQLKECAKAMKLANSPNFQIVNVLCDAHEWQLASRELDENDGKSMEILEKSASLRIQTLWMDLERRKAEFERYYTRLTKVRETKLKKLEQFAAGEIDDLRDDVSMISSISSKSGSSKVSMASTVRRRKQIEKKKNSLKEGGEYEDSALLNVLAECYQWVSQVRTELVQLIPVLIIIDKMAEALDYQALIEKFSEKLTKTKNSIWPENLNIQHLPGPLYTLLDPTLEPSPMPPVFRLEPELIAPPTNFSVIFP